VELMIAHVPIIGIDIWEHAFYLQYKNVKPDVSPSMFRA
jgi:Fe-Mn family superoxide dismutase